MLIQLNSTRNDDQFDKLISQLNADSIQYFSVNTGNKEYLVCNSGKEMDLRRFGSMAAVEDIFRVTDQYKLVSSQWRIHPTIIDLGDGIKIGDGNLSIMAGPCAIESEEQVESVVEHLVANKIKIMRGGVFKPRSSPYSFRGLGIDGLKLFHSHCRKKGIKIITEVMEQGQIDSMYEFVDIFQVGARNSQNFNLLDELGSLDKPVLLKRAISGTIDELLHSAEYIFSKGNDQLMLCERGIRTYETIYRNTFDINAISILKEKTHLPVIADPSHGVGIRKHVPVIALAATIAGADGIIYEVHPQPEKAKSDGQQTLNYQESERLVIDLRKLQVIRN